MNRLRRKRRGAVEISKEIETEIAQRRAELWADIKDEWPELAELMTECQKKFGRLDGPPVFYTEWKGIKIYLNY